MTELVADLIRLEREARNHMNALSQRIAYWASERRHALTRLHEELGTWREVADATGQKLPTVHKAASQPRKKNTS
jgi:hypothetical protein